MTKPSNIPASDGTYEVAVSKTRVGSMDEAMQVWLKLFNDRPDFDGVAITQPPTSTTTKKRRHWACNLADGTRVNADVYPKTPEKVTLSITHTKLPDQATAKHWRLYWKDFLKSL